MFFRVKLYGESLQEIIENMFVFRVKDMFLRVRKHGMALPEIIEKRVFWWWSGGKRAGWRRGGGGQRRIDFARNLSEQSVLLSDQTRSVEHHMETNTVTRISANTTPIKNKNDKTSSQNHDLFDAQHWPNPSTTTCQKSTQQHKNTLEAV